VTVLACLIKTKSSSSRYCQSRVFWRIATEIRGGNSAPPARRRGSVIYCKLHIMLE